MQAWPCSSPVASARPAPESAPEDARAPCRAVPRRCTADRLDHRHADDGVWVTEAGWRPAVLRRSMPAAVVTGDPGYRRTGPHTRARKQPHRCSACFAGRAQAGRRSVNCCTISAWAGTLVFSGALFVETYGASPSPAEGIIAARDSSRRVPRRGCVLGERIRGACARRCARVERCRGLRSRRPASHRSSMTLMFFFTVASVSEPFRGRRGVAARIVIGISTLSF